MTGRYDYTPFGNEIGASVGMRDASQGYSQPTSVKQGYALTESDTNGLKHTWFRKLDSKQGRFTSPDPYAGSMSIANPQSFNRYSYVENDPVNFVDPSGLLICVPRYVETCVTVDGERECSNPRFVGYTCYDIGGGGSSGGSRDFDVEGIRGGLEKAWEKPDCKKFIQSLLQAVGGKNKKNPLEKGGDIMQLFDAVMSQGRLTRNPPPGSAGIGSPIGSIRGGDAAVFAVSGSSSSAAAGTQLDTMIIPHELMHLAGVNAYYKDMEFSNKMAAMPQYAAMSRQPYPGAKNYPYRKNAERAPNHPVWGQHWGDVLNQLCFER